MTNDSANDSRPIGLFDSGIGGLTVLKTLREVFPNENFIYLGDTARLPYGTKSAATIERYLWQNVAFLKSRNVKAIVVACNSASTVLLGRTHQEENPIYNVIEPGAHLALQKSQTKRIAVLGTRATVSAQAYVRAIQELLPAAQVFQQACPLLVPLVEEGWVDDPITNLIVYRYLSPLAQQNVDTVILGCTHYPVLKNAVAKVMGQQVALIESSTAIALQIQTDMKSGRLRSSQSGGGLEILTTDVSASFQEVAMRLMHPYIIPALVNVDL